MANPQFVAALQANGWTTQTHPDGRIMVRYCDRWWFVQGGNAAAPSLIAAEPLPAGFNNLLFNK